MDRENKNKVAIKMCLTKFKQRKKQNNEQRIMNK